MAARDQEQPTSKPVEVYRNPQGEPVEVYSGQQAVLPPFEMVQRGRYHYRRTVRTRAWISHDPWLGKYGCGVCHCNACDEECPGQECPDRYGRRSGKRAEEGPEEDDGRRIPLAEVFGQAGRVMAREARPEELTPPAEREEQRA